MQTGFLMVFTSAVHSVLAIKSFKYMRNTCLTSTLWLHFISFHIWRKKCLSKSVERLMWRKRLVPSLGLGGNFTIFLQFSTHLPLGAESCFQ